MSALRWVRHQDGRYCAKGHKFGVDYYVSRKGRTWILEEYAGDVDEAGEPQFVYVDHFLSLLRAQAHAAYREGAPAHLGIGPVGGWPL